MIVPAHRLLYRSIQAERHTAERNDRFAESEITHHCTACDVNKWQWEDCSWPKQIYAIYWVYFLVAPHLSSSDQKPFLQPLLDHWTLVNHSTTQRFSSTIIIISATTPAVSPSFIIVSNKWTEWMAEIVRRTHTHTHTHIHTAWQTDAKKRNNLLRSLQYFGHVVRGSAGKLGLYLISIFKIQPETDFARSTHPQLQ